MAFTLQAFVADPTLATGGLGLPDFVANPTLSTGNIRVQAFVADASLLAGGLRLGGFSTTDVARLPKIIAAGTGAQIGNTSSVTLPVIQATGAGSTVPYIYSILTTPQYLATGTGFSEDIVAFPRILASGTAEEFAVQDPVYLPRIIASGYAIEAATSDATLWRIIAAAQGYSGSIGTSNIELPLHVASGMGYVPAIGTSVSVILPIIIASGFGFTTGANFSTVAMHTETQAITTYSNYPFNSFAKFNGVYLGASDDGIFALTGADDAGTFIDAYARVGITDYATSHLKRIDRMYVGYRTDGQLILRVFTEDNTQRDYLMRSTGKTGIHGNHVRIGKGVEARYWQFEIRNKDGADFQLDMMEAKPTVLTRRVGGGNA